MKSISIILLVIVCLNIPKAHGQIYSDTLGASSQNSGSGASPFNNITYLKTYLIYRQSELAAKGIVPGMTIYGLGYHKTDSNSLISGVSATLKLNIRSGGQDTVIPSSWPSTSWPFVVNNYLTGGFQPVMQYSNGFNLNVPASPGWIPFMLDAPFVYTGGSIEVYSDWQSAQNSLSGNVSFSYESLSYAVIFHTAYPSPGGGSTGSYRPSTIFYHSAAPSVCNNQPIGGNAITNNWLCPNQNFTMYLLNCSAGSGISYQWQSAAMGGSVWSPISGATNPSLTTFFSTPTQYRCNVTCAGSGLSAASTSVQAQPFIFNIDTIYTSISGDTVNFQAQVNDTNGVAGYLWSFGDGGFYGGNPTQHIYTIDSSFTVRVSAQGGCNADTAYITVSVGCPAGNTFHNTISTPLGDSMCIGQVRKLKTNVPIPLGYVGQWQILGNFGVWYNITGATADTIMVSPTTTSQYRNVATCTTSGNKKTSLGRKITVVPLPSAGIVLATKTAEKTYSFTASGVTGASAYHWSFGDGTTANTLAAMHQYANYGNYTVVFTATSTPGCYDTAVLHLLTTGICMQENLKTFAIVPNPAQDKINITLSGSAKQVVVSLTDMTGRVVANLYSGAATGLSQPIALPSTAAGLYFVHIVADGIKLPIEKLMITK